MPIKRAAKTHGWVKFVSRVVYAGDRTCHAFKIFMLTPQTLAVQKLLSTCQALGFPVEREGNRLRVTLPGIEHRVLAALPHQGQLAQLLQKFWDTIVFEVDATGEIRSELDWDGYWQGVPGFLHVVLQILIFLGARTLDSPLDSPMSSVAFLLSMSLLVHVLLAFPAFFLRFQKQRAILKRVVKIA